MKILLVISLLLLLTITCKDSVTPEKGIDIHLKDIEKTTSSVKDSLKTEIVKDDLWSLLNNKIEWYKNGLSPQTEISLFPDDFKSFYTKFSSDSVFQYNNIHFNKLIAIIAECEESIILNNGNWTFEPLIELDSFDNNKSLSSLDSSFMYYFYVTVDRVLLIQDMEDIGNITSVGFEKVDNKWKLTLFLLNVC